MRDDLVSELRSVAEILCLHDVLSIEALAGRLLAEAADELEKKQAKPAGTVFFSGNDVLNQISKKNQERAEQGLPPL